MKNFKKINSSPLVSIITPSYNSGRFIDDCIKSVLAQDYPNVEHIIYDAVSTDKTKSILGKYQNKKYDGRIKIFIEPDRGPVYAANKALLKSKGDIILDFNADDILMPNACSWAVENFAKNPKVAVIYGDVEIIGGNGMEIKTEISKPYSFKELVCSELVIPTQAAFIRRKVLNESGFIFDRSFKHCGDFDLWLRMGMRHPIKHVSGIVLKYRWHEKSRTRNADLIENFVEEKKIILDKLLGSSKTTENIRRFKKKAEAGLYFWAASMAIDSRKQFMALDYLNRSLMISPSEKKLDEYILYWKQAVSRGKTNEKVRKAADNFPLVSIVTPSYNSGKFIRQCIESVLSQDYPYIEHIIHDGLSTDETGEILRAYSSPRYTGRVKIFTESDSGQSDALNRAIQKSKGDIILVLNADDMLMPDAVSWGVEQIKNNPKYGVVYGDSYIIDENGQIININVSKEFDFERLLCVELVPPAQAAFIRRSALEKVGFWADAKLDTCPDYEMWVRITQKFPMLHVFGIITKYRHHEQPQHDSGKERTTKRFVDAKREVMDRIFNDPKTPQATKDLRRRAYASLDLWASQTAYGLGQPKQAFLYLLRSFWLRPTEGKFLKIINEIRLFLKHRVLF